MFEQPAQAPTIRSVTTIREDIDALKPAIVAVRALLMMEDGTKQTLREVTLSNLQEDLKANESKLIDLENELASLEKPETVSTLA